MHEPWQDLIPFYVAGTLSRAEVAGLEAHLAVCTECRQALDEWRMIAEHVRSDAFSRARALPPLSKNVREQLRVPSVPATSQNGRHAEPLPPKVEARAPEPTLEVLKPVRATQPRTGRSSLPLTLGAAAAVIVLFGGILVFLMMRGSSDDEFAAPGIAAVASPTSRRPTPTNTVTITPQLDILPTPAPSLSGGENVANGTGGSGIGGGSGGGGGQPVSPGINSIGAPLGTPQPTPAVCAITNTTGSAVQIYREVYLPDEIVGFLNPGITLNVFLRGADRWVKVMGADGRVLGWVNGAGMTLSGPCADLAVPTPTQIGATPFSLDCRLTVTAQELSPLRTGPGESYEALMNLQETETLFALGRSDNNWFRVRYDGTMVSQIGWVPQSAVIAYGTCGELPMYASVNYVPEPTAFLPTPDSSYMTPTSEFNGLIDPTRFDWVTTSGVGSLPANTRVRIESAYYNGSRWVYTIIAQGTDSMVEATAGQLRYAPQPETIPSPTAPFQELIGMGQFNIVTTTPVGSIPPNTRVRLSTLRVDDGKYLYVIVTQNGLSAEATINQLAYALDATPGAPTPTPSPLAPPATTVR
ncbi:MAG: zf-HC2 domain-containing protein [bacterium]|nr:zf-HC2 domain-containing protein [bacterium]